MADLFDLSGLSPMAKARTEAALAKRFRYSDGIRTLGEDLQQRFDRGELVAKQETDSMIEWSRTRFNRMNGREQAEYEARLKSKRLYWLQDRDGFGHAVPKLVFDVAQLEIRP